MVGTITGVGGGTVRDVVIRNVPTVLSSGLYAIPAARGATLTALALGLRFYSGLSPWWRRRPALVSAWQACAST